MAAAERPVVMPAEGQLVPEGAQAPAVPGAVVHPVAPAAAVPEPAAEVLVDPARVAAATSKNKTAGGTNGIR